MSPHCKDFSISIKIFYKIIFNASRIFHVGIIIYVIPYCYLSNSNNMHVWFFSLELSILSQKWSHIKGFDTYVQSQLTKITERMKSSSLNPRSNKTSVSSQVPCSVTCNYLLLCSQDTALSCWLLLPGAREGHLAKGCCAEDWNDKKSVRLAQ